MLVGRMEYGMAFGWGRENVVLGGCFVAPHRIRTRTVHLIVLCHKTTVQTSNDESYS